MNPPPPIASARPPVAETSPRPPAPRDAADAIRVVLADGNPLYREGLTDLLAGRPGYRVLLGVDHAEAAVEACRQHQPDLLLIELRLGGLMGLQSTLLIEQVREASPNTQVVGFSRHLDPPTVWRVLRSGADGLLSKDSTLDELLTAMHAVHTGNVYLCSVVQRLLVRRALRKGEQGGAGRWSQLSATRTRSRRPAGRRQEPARDRRPAVAENQDRGLAPLPAAEQARPA